MVLLETVSKGGQLAEALHTAPATVAFDRMKKVFLSTQNLCVTAVRRTSAERQLAKRARERARTHRSAVPPAPRVLYTPHPVWRTNASNIPH